MPAAIKLIAILAAVIIISALLLIFMICPALRKHPDIKLLYKRYIAHRGLHDLEANTPENSLASFRKAAEEGYAIENDIHLTADGEVIVFHDNNLIRMCGIDKAPEEMTLKELKKLKLAGTTEQIPTLKECLDTVNGKVPLLIEFKCNGLNCKKLCEAAEYILSNYNGKYFIQSFYPTVLLWYRKNRRDICRGQLATAFYGKALYMRMLGGLLFNFLGRPDFVSYEFKYINHPLRRLCVKLGAFPVCWTFHSMQEIESCRRQCKAYIFEGFRKKDINFFR